MPSAERIGELLFRFVREELNPDETRELESWKSASPENLAVFNDLTDKQQLRRDLKEIYEQEEAVWEKLRARIPELNQPNIRPARKNKLYYWLTAAAIALLVLGTGLYIALRKTPVPHELAGKSAPAKEEIVPGGNHAILTLSGGKTILLDSTLDGQIQANISKKDSGQLVYAQESPSGAVGVPVNTLSTPRGGQYKVTLSDGTQVWLNAASSLSYPEQFAGKERNVSLTGEAYFEVAKDASKPFKVLINNKNTVEVLGTHFNIMAYADEPFEATTLLEGKVKINGTIMLPGQQAKIKNEVPMVSISEIDTRSAIAWKNGITSFKNADIKTIMRIVSRWYDVDVSYLGEIPASENYVGGIPRNSSLDNVLKALAISGIHFTVTGKKIIVSP